MADHVNAVRPAYEARVRKSRGVFGRFWSELGERAESLKPWLELIPDDHGLRTLRAGLMIILQARARLFCFQTSQETDAGFVVQ